MKKMIQTGPGVSMELMLLADISARRGQNQPPSHERNASASMLRVGAAATCCLRYRCRNILESLHKQLLKLRHHR